MHMAFNQFPDRPLIAMVGAITLAPLALIAIFAYGTREAERWLVTELAEHRSALEALRGGRWPDGPSGEKIAALAGRLDTEGAKHIRRYWELQAWLVAEAEETMIEKAAGDAPSSTGSSARSAAARSPHCRRSCRSVATTNGRSPS